MDYASTRGHINVLEWWKNSAHQCCHGSADMQNSTHVKNSAHQCCHGSADIQNSTHVKNSGLELKFSAYTMSCVFIRDYVDACTKGYISPMEWWRKCDFESKYPKYTFEYETIHHYAHASKCNYNDIITWWEKTGLRINIDNLH